MHPVHLKGEIRCGASKNCPRLVRYGVITGVPKLDRRSGLGEGWALICRSPAGAGREGIGGAGGGRAGWTRGARPLMKPVRRGAFGGFQLRREGIVTGIGAG